MGAESHYHSDAYLFISQFMPRSGVDDLQSWTQIASGSAINSLTTCITTTMAQHHVLPGLSFLSFSLFTEHCIGTGQAHGCPVSSLLHLMSSYGYLETC